MPAKRRRGAILMLLCGSALLLGMGGQTGCRRAGGERHRVELVIWSAPTGIEEQSFQRLCRRFEAEHPGVTVRNVGAMPEDKLVRAIVAAAPPDLAYLYGTSYLGPLAANGALHPLDAEFARSGLREADFLPGAIGQGRYHNRLYAMPVTRDCHAFYRNRDRLRKAGFDPDAMPRTLEATLDLARRLTHLNPDGSVARLGMSLPADPLMLFYLFGGAALDQNTGQVTANRPENVAALRWLVALADAQGGYRAISAYAAGFGKDESGQNPLATGKIAMRIDGEWAAMYLEKYAPGTDYALGELPYPAARPDLRNMAWEDGDIMVIPTGSHHTQLAWEFLRWMQLPAQQEGYAAQMNNLPSLLTLRDSPRLSQGSRSKRALGYVLQHIASNAANARYFPPTPVATLYRSVLRHGFDLALYHQKSPEQALNDVQIRIERETRRYQTN